MKINNRMMFYCLDCDNQVQEAKLDYDRFYCCPSCGVPLGVVKKDEEEQ